MKILVVGSGGREHAIADALARNTAVRRLYAAPGNGGIRDVAELVAIDADDMEGLVGFAREQHIDLTVVGPEVPLSKGIVDTFRKTGLTIVGPTADQARLESSKSHAKRFFRDNNIPTAAFHECASVDEALGALERSGYPAVIKADGLAAGKGVVIAGDAEEARSTIRRFMTEGSLGEAGRKVVIEEFLTGVEASFHVFADGTDFQPMVVAQDHKRRYEADRGPNTGGMGAYSDDSIISPDLRRTVIDTIIRPTLHAAGSYSGVLYAGLMLTTGGPKLIEYNARFGDPEAQVILPRLRTDLVEVLMAIAEHRLASRTLEWSSESTATVALVSSGYPASTAAGKRITGLSDASKMNGVKIYHAGTTFEDGHYFTKSGRVLNVTARGASLAQALDRAYEAAAMIEFEGKDYRRDIGQKGLQKQL